MGYHLGIDLGTTYTGAGVHRDGRVEIASLGDRAPTIPSVVFLREDGVVLTGDAANRRAVTEPNRVAREFKRRLGDPTPVLVGGVPYPAEVLIARLLAWVVEKVSDEEGGPPDSIALSHPANWGDYKLDLLRQAVRHADLDPNKVSYLTEPEAAAIYYASHERVEPGAVVAVYDLGGGTFDVAVLRKEADGFAILGTPEGIERLGGIDVDSAVWSHVDGSLDGALGRLDPDQPGVMPAVARLRQDCVEAKEALSSDVDTSIAVTLPGLQTEVRLTRTELESMIRPVLSETITALRRALRSAEVEPAQVQAVLLVGGSSRMPLVGQLVSAELGRPVAVDTHPKHSVALGAAIAAATRAGAGNEETITPLLAAAEAPVTASIPIVVPTVPSAAPAPTPPVAPVAVPVVPQSHAPVEPPSVPTVPVAVQPPPRPPEPSRVVWDPAAHRPALLAPRRRGKGLVVVLIVVVLALAGVIGALLINRDDSPPKTASAFTAPTSDPVGSPGPGADTGPGPPPGFVAPPTAAAPVGMRALRHGLRNGYERIAVDFAGNLPVKVSRIERREDLGALRVFFANPAPVAGDGVPRLHVDSGLIADVFFVNDGNETFVDVFTKGVADAVSFGLADAIGADGKAKGIVAIDVFSKTDLSSWAGLATFDAAGVVAAFIQGDHLHIEGYGQRASGRGVVRVLDESAALVTEHNVPLSASGNINGRFKLDIPLSELGAGPRSIFWTSDDPADNVDGRPPDVAASIELG
ncbi:MAG: hypothetical protein QOJ67_594 [Acidimicrobiaceae bacterium]